MPIVPAHSHRSDVSKVSKSGDTMTGPLVISGPGRLEAEADNGNGVGAQLTAGTVAVPEPFTIVASELNLGGGADSPIWASSVVTKGYVDSPGATLGDAPTPANGWAYPSSPGQIVRVGSVRMLQMLIHCNSGTSVDFWPAGSLAVGDRPAYAVTVPVRSFGGAGVNDNREYWCGINTDGSGFIIIFSGEAHPTPPNWMQIYAIWAVA